METAASAPASGGSAGQSGGIWGTAVLLSFVLTPVMGYFAVGRWRRAALAGAIVIAYFAMMGVAVLGVMPRLMWATIAVSLALWLAALVDVARLSRQSPRRSWKWVVPVGLGMTLALQAVSSGFRAFVAEAFQAPAGSMLPTLAVGDHFFVGKPLRTPGRGDVIVFRYPRDPNVDYVKRVVAVGGDTVELVNGALVINGQPVPRERPAAEAGDPPPGQPQRWRERLDGHSYEVLESTPATSVASKIPEGHVFVMGDNRDVSHDSRAWGSLPLALVKGRALFIWWSKGPEGLRWDRFDRTVD